MSLRTSIQRQRMTAQGRSGNPWDWYIQDGLVFQLDCDTECTAELWSDIKGGVQFIGRNVQLVDGVPYFESPAIYSNDKNLGFYRDSHTIEICFFETSTVTNATLMISGENGTVGIAKFEGKFQNASLGSTIRSLVFPIQQSVGLHSISFSNDKAVDNGVEKMPDGTDTWGGSFSGYMIGNRNDRGNYPFFGKIYSIRIYNRLLTAAEMRANQAIDLGRFGNR